MVVTIKIIANIGVMISRLLISNARKSIYLQIQNPKAFSNGELFSRAIFEPSIFPEIFSPNYRAGPVMIAKIFYSYQIRSQSEFRIGLYVIAISFKEDQIGLQ